MVQYNDRFRDRRSGQFRKPSSYEKNRYFRIDTLTAGIANFAFKSSNRIAEATQGFADDLLAYAKSNAPWEDRTGEARAGLDVLTTMDNENLNIDLFHTVDYGIWLEVRWGGKYAIIIPSVETLGPRLFDKMSGMLGDIYYP